MALGGAARGFEATFRVACYSEASALLNIVPVCGSMLAPIMMIVLMVIGVVRGARHHPRACRRRRAAAHPAVLLLPADPAPRHARRGDEQDGSNDVLTLRAKTGALPLGAIFLGIGAVAALAVAVLHLDRLPFLVCLFHAATGIPCLTCGATRALADLAAGDVRGALAMNPLATLGAFALVPWGLGDLALMTRGRALSVEVAPPAARVLRVLAIVAVIANWGYLVAVGR